MGLWPLGSVSEQALCPLEALCLAVGSAHTRSRGDPPCLSRGALQVHLLGSLLQPHLDQGREPLFISILFSASRAVPSECG